MLYLVKLLLNITDYDQDELIENILEMCKEEATTYCNLKFYNPALNNIVVMMAVERYNKLTTEGASKVAMDGISEEYLDGYSKNIYDSLKRYRRIGVL